MHFKHFFAELKRRHVFRVAVVYAVVAWVVIQVASDIFPALNLPEWTVTLVVILSFLGFPIALVLGWAFDITPDGVERTDARDQPQSVEHPANQLSPRGNQRTSGPSRKPYPRRNRSVPVPDGSGATESQPPDPARVKRASLAYLRHEIRTPVNAIIGYSEMLLEDVTAPEQQELAADLQKIHTAGKQILSIVDDILHPEKIALAKTDEDPHAFRVQLRHALRTPLNAVIGYSEMLIEGGRETNRKDLLPDLQRILDAARHVLGLVNDIVQLSATDTGGQGENARFAAGSVMAQEVLAKIRPLAAGPRRDPEIQEGCLLVVDDNDMNRDLLARQLARGGYSVRAARNGREALEMVRVQDFDLILLDIMMPELDGFEVLRQLKSDTMLRDIPVIMISALDEIDSVIRCVEMGAEDYLSKPFDPVLLKARVGANVEVRHMRDRERTYAEQLSLEQEFADRLLLSVFPSSIAERFRAGENKIADFFPEATALWAELDGPPRSAARSSATDVLGRLGEMWSVFDQDARQLGLETFEVAGHTCLIAGGVPTPREDHADAVAEMALRMLDATQQYEAKTGEPLQIRVGIHTGSIFAGVVGTARLTYGLWGDAIHAARHLNAHGDSGAILISPATYIRLRDRYHFQNKGVVEIAGKGQMLTYLLQGRAEPSRSAI
jgi:CheY-like chemotaxis protein